LLHAYTAIDDLNPDDIELRVMAKDSVIQQVKPYLNTIKRNIVLAQRQLESKGGLKTLILIGGSTRLMDSTFKSSLKAIAPNLIIKDEFENARSNLKFAQKEITNGIT
jgi:coproporphyrinogen III oxidase-like Fe-S oxidoreductase